MDPLKFISLRVHCTCVLLDMYVSQTTAAVEFCSCMDTLYYVGTLTQVRGPEGSRCSICTAIC